MRPMLANMGVPMIFVELPGMVCALLPIIIVEAVIIHRVLALSYRDSFKGISIANLASTLAGVPAAWFIMLAFQFIVTIPLGLAAQHHMVDSPAVAVICYLSSIAWVPPAGD